jgi:membrane protease YdiL (CAAX protease family)
LRNYPKLLTPTDEFIIVIVTALGATLVANVLFVLYAERAGPAITEAALYRLLTVEPILLLLIGGFLYARDWTFETVGLLPTLKETIIGVGLAFVIAIGAIAVWQVVLLSGWRPPARAIVGGQLSAVTIIAVSVLNPIFEESIFSGYIVTALKRRTTGLTAVAVSVGLRALCHIYQGYGVIFIVVFGVVLAVWYARYGRLWPVIVAHVFYDFFPLLAYQA